MNATSVEKGPWSRRRWSGLVLGLSALQLLLLAWFGSRGPFRPRPISPAPQLTFAGSAASELLALTDPTLFAQGSPHGFSGASWMQIESPFTNQPPEWSEPPRLLALNARQLGADFRRFMQTNRPFTVAFTAKPPPRPTAPKIEESPPATSAPSTFRVEGELARRPLESSLTLPPQEAMDLLTDSVVQVLVNGDGTVMSATLLASSGKRAADEKALSLAKSACFAPLPRTNALQASVSLTRGTLVFSWQTIPQSISNAPSARP